MAPLASVIILNYNGLKFVERCVRSVLKTDYPNFEVIFVDNGSSDGSNELVKKLFGSDPRLIFIENSRNMGYSDGNNEALRYAKGKVIVFLNNDTVVDKRWLRNLIITMENDAQVGAARCNIVDAYYNKLGYSIGHTINILGYGYPMYEKGKKNDEGYIKEIPFAESVALAIKNSVISEVSFNNYKLFDSDYFIYYDDTDVSWRIKLRGYKIIVVSSSSVRHFGTFIGRMSPRMIFLFAKNRITTLLKNYNTINMLKYVPLLLIFDLARAIILIKNKKLSYSFAILLAIWWNLRNLKKIWIKRSVVQRLIRKYPDSHVMTHMVRFDPVILYSNFKKVYLD